MDLKLFVDVYEKLSLERIDTLSMLYHPEVHFQDPAHETHGLPALLAYFRTAYTPLLECRFNIETTIKAPPLASVTWCMTLAHPKLARGQPHPVAGCSVLRYQDDLIIDHRDYFDMGAMIYEHLPVMRTIIRTIKQRMHS